MQVETILQIATLAVAVASGFIAVSILRRLKNENTEVSWRYLIAASVAFVMAQALTLAESAALPWLPSQLFLYEPEAAYLVFAALFLLGVARQHQVARNEQID
jgi:hypothetical protein